MSSRPSSLSRTALLAFSCMLGGFLAYAAYANIARAQFSGPTCTAGNCSGAIAVDSGNNLSVGTSTVLSDTRLYILGGNSTTTAFAIQLKNPEGRPLFVLRNDGRVVMGPFPIGSSTTSLFPSASTLLVRGLIETVDSLNPNIGGGIKFPDGTIQTTAAASTTATSTTYAVNVSAGKFGQNTGGGNYSFPARLGVGTTTPAVQLHISSAYPAFQRFTTSDATANNKNWEFRPSSVAWGDFAITALNDDGSLKGYRLMIDPSGNVGIGTTTPSDILDIAGRLRFSANSAAPSANVTAVYRGSTTGLSLTGKGSTYDIYMANAAGADVVGVPTGTTNVYFPGNVGIGTTTPATNLEVKTSSDSNGIRISGTATPGFQMYTSSANGNARNWGWFSNYSQFGDLTFQVSSNNTGSPYGGTTVLYLDGVNKRVGVGTTTPGYPLHVYGASPRISLTDSGTSFGLFQVTNNNAVSWFGQETGTANTIAANSLANATIVGAANGFATQFITSDAVRMTILSGGNVGVGKTNPGFLLDSASTINADTSYSLGGWLANSWSGNTIRYGGISASQWDSIALYTSAAERVRVDTSGRVGIATTTPTALLSVGTSTTGLVATFGAGNGKINVGTVDPVYTIGGTQYATYLPGMTGQKEETTGILRCRLQVAGCSYEIDFKNLEEGSDLWLFAKTTNLVKNEAHFKAMTALLSPAFDGNAWYEKNVAGRTLTIHASPSPRYPMPSTLELSYRLSAPRFDSATWTNFSHDGDEGFNLDKLIQ